MTMPIDLLTTWFSELKTSTETVTVRDGSGGLIEQTWPMPKPSGSPVSAVDYCDRILASYRKGDVTLCLVQAGEGEDVRFAVVPQSSIGSPTKKL